MSIYDRSEKVDYQGLIGVKVLLSHCTASFDASDISVRA